MATLEYRRCSDCEGSGRIHPTRVLGFLWMADGNPPKPEDTTTCPRCKGWGNIRLLAGREVR